MRKSLFSLFVSMALLVSFSTPSWAKVVDLDSLQAQLSQNEVVRGDFKQSRHLEMFNQPLTSTGILLSANRTVYFGNSRSHLP